MDEDHLDIYENKANLLEAFEAFAGQVNPQGGRLFLKKGLQLKQTQVTGYYGVEVKADCYADGLLKMQRQPSRWLWKPEYSLRKSGEHCLTLRE